MTNRPWRALSAHRPSGSGSRFVPVRPARQRAHGLEHAGHQERDQAEERQAHQCHDQALRDDLRALAGLACAKVLRSHRVRVREQAHEKAEGEERGHATAQRRCHMHGVDLRHEVAIGENHYRKRALRHHHRQRESQ